MSEIPTLVGDYSDDDAAYLDDLVESVPTPPAPDELPTDNRALSPAPPSFPTPPGSRLMARSNAYANNVPPMLVLPTDPYRRGLRVTALAAPVYFADNVNVLSNAAGLAHAYAIPANTTLWLDGYTGPVCLGPLPGGDGLTSWGFAVVAVSE